ncbi:hypothetical protein B0H21DRAFT_750157 [Amylocystis lapponica]|nr:hypothetical protein B0H21DRAFT_750157 [Amylocystis lapponica]
MDAHIPAASISPDGRTLLCVGDSPDVFLYRITGGARISFSPIAMLSLSQYIDYSPHHTFWSNSSCVPASFSTAFSSDGSKFAVTSQEGAVVVWDVRSTKPLKVFETDKSRSTASGGNGGASGWLNDAPWDWANGHGRAPGWGVRTVKFSPAGVGREVMTFTEHTSQVHFVDARTFDQEEIVRVPNFEAYALPSPQPRPRSVSPPRTGSLAAAAMSTEALPLPPPRIVLFSGALEDTFRIPDLSPRWRPRPSRRVLSREDLAEDEADSIVVIPPLGDREVEDDVRRLLGRHGLQTRRTESVDREWVREDGAGWEHLEEAGEGEMDVDELESDCFSSHTPSRAPSPVSAAPPMSRSLDMLRAPRPSLLVRRESSGPYIARQTPGASRRHRRALQADVIPDVDQDLAGVCFDPSGTCVYVASTRGVAEWKVRGAEQRWWADTTWA